MDQNELDELINDLEGIVNDKQEIKPIPKSQNTNKKCVQAYIGNPTEKKVCSNLRCNKCDLKVNIFQNKEWNQDVDYLVFRNYFNNPTKLSEHQKNMQNSQAYCCQCYNISTNQIQQAPQQWRCAGHC